MDPITAIANAVGGLANVAGSIISGRQQLKLSESYQDQATREYLIAQQKARNTTNQIFVLAFVLIILGLIVAIVIRRK